MAPSALVASIILLVQALFGFIISAQYSQYTILRHGILVTNGIIWYFLRNRFSRFCLYMLPFQYACYTGFIIYFCWLEDLGANIQLLNVLEGSVNEMTFVTISLFFAGSFKSYLYTYLPTFTFFHCTFGYFMMRKINDGSVGLVALALIHTLFFCLLTTVLVYRMFLI